MTAWWIGKILPPGSATAVLRRVPGLVALLICAGCGRAGDPPPSSAPGIQFGGTLIVDSPRLRSLDPLEATDVNSSSIAGELYEGLVGYSPENLRDFVPVLARDWTVSEDGGTWTFRLRPGVRFHDDPCFTNGRGRPVTVGDVRYTIRRGLRGGSETRASSLRETLVGGEDFAAGRTDEISGLDMVDDRTIRFTVRRSGNEFLHALASVAGWVVPREAVERYGSRFGRHTVGTGPFRLASWSDESLVLVRNRGYWKTDREGNRLPYLDQVVFRSAGRTERGQASFSDLLDGRLHLIYFTGEIDWIEFQPLGKFMAERGIRTVSIPKWNTIYYGWNMSRDNVWTRNRDLRRAVALAMRRPEDTDLLQAAGGLLPPGLPGCGWTAHPRIPDPEGGRELLARAGHAEGRGLPPLRIGTLGGSRFLTEMVLDPLNGLGIRTEVEAAPWKRHWEAVERGEYEFFRGGWIADYPDAENFFAVFYSRSPVNQTRYANPDFDRRFERFRELPAGSPERTDLCREMEGILRDEVPAVFLYHEKSLYLIHPRVRNIEPSINPMERKLYEYVWLEPPGQP